MKFLTLDDSVSRSIAAPRLRATLVSTFASLALLLAIAGVYAVISYTTAQRTPEFGLRVAIGARTADILRLVLGGAGGLALMGIGAGLRARADRRAACVAAMLFGVTPHGCDDLPRRLPRHAPAGDCAPPPSRPGARRVWTR